MYPVTNAIEVLQNSQSGIIDTLPVTLVLIL